jgi:ketosteroid isomerase-like protein
VDSANVELVRSIFAAWERGDFGSVAWADPAIEFVLADGPDPVTETGVAEMAEAWRGRLSAFDDYRGIADEYRELDLERVLVFHQRSGRAKTSGVEVGQWQAGGATVFHIRDGRVTRLVAYLDRDRALADLGFAPEGGSASS